MLSCPDGDSVDPPPNRSMGGVSTLLIYAIAFAAISLDAPWSFLDPWSYSFCRVAAPAIGPVGPVDDHRHRGRGGTATVVYSTTQKCQDSVDPPSDRSIGGASTLS
ncbi:hypothetical protein THAOC_04265 [Thalassiosira oceanica]|uniref:Uncharacterized protein n=1 Tax=Thalassiosira oceanica TaxID=159749 RepID=K0T5N2_THAOC|nr:hypothetical protein THAOC_04265 [Thalassiosira oceanica]|eukprot:EJK74083.1 hypothetical protein THAOC_04265 [Thalassiosira oceanica]